MSATFHFHRLRRALGNFSLLAHRDCAGHLASMHQSGTHWLKFMLASALARHYGVPGPRYNHANDFIAGPHDEIDVADEVDATDESDGADETDARNSGSP